MCWQWLEKALTGCIIIIIIIIIIVIVVDSPCKLLDSFCVPVNWGTA